MRTFIADSGRAQNESPRMYEMQGLRLDDQCKLIDCPDELDRWGNQRSFALSVLPTTRTPGENPVTRSFSVLRKLPKALLE
jgi:hypothetical protein